MRVVFTRNTPTSISHVYGVRVGVTCSAPTKGAPREGRLGAWNASRATNGSKKKPMDSATTLTNVKAFPVPVARLAPTRRALSAASAKLQRPRRRRETATTS